MPRSSARAEAKSIQTSVSANAGVELLRALVIEDSLQDAELLARELKRGGFSLVHKRVERKEDLPAVFRERWDVVFSDFNLPGFNAFDALELLNRTGKDIPFIVLSGAVGEEIAVELMRLGARDFIKKDDLARVVPVVKREVREAKNRETHRRHQSSLEFLAKLGPVLASSLQYEEIVKKVSQLAVEQFGGWCAVHVADESGELEPVSVAHVDAQKTALVQELQVRFPPPRTAPIGANHVFRTGVPEIVKEISDELIAAAAVNEEHLSIMRELGLRSYIGVPLVARGRIFGAISFVCTDGNYDDEHLHLALEVASRFALALDNASLYAKSQQAIAEARKAVTARDEFLSIASHELNTPLTTLKLQVQMRRKIAEKKGWEYFSPDRLKKLFEDDEKQINRLVRLVDDMLDISRLTNGKYQLAPEKMDLTALVGDTLKRFAPQTRAANIEVVLDAPESVVGCWDYYRIEQVFVNLLTNAIKYGNRRPVHVSVLSKDGKAHLAVRDQGLGIAPADLDRIFRQFERAVSANEVSGLGLGLFIAKQLVDAHKGRIRVESTLGSGSTFIVELPL